MIIAALIVAAGRGTRAGGGRPKQWREIAGASVAHWTLRAFSAHPCVIVIHPDDIDHARAATRDIDVRIVTGGATRAASVRAGLEALSASPPDLVLIHDVARCCVTAHVIDGVVEALKHHPAAAPALPVTDALWTGEAGLVTGTRDRSGLFRAQTPQGFHFAEILAAHRAFRGDAADDVEVARAHGLAVAITQGDEDNFKITGPGDFARAAELQERRHGH